MRIWVWGACALLVVAMAVPAHAGTVQLVAPEGDCGWEASWDASLDGLVDVVAQAKVGDICVIEKSAEFTSLGAIDITFTQTGNATGLIAINDEILTNSSGVDWTAFQMSLSGVAVFDPALTAGSGGGAPIGWTIDPNFTNAVFSAGNTVLDIDTGPGVPNNTQWFPGDGATNGELFILASSEFTLTELPIPEPSTLALLSIGAIGLLRRRR